MGNHFFPTRTSWPKSKLTTKKKIKKPLRVWRVINHGKKSARGPLFSPIAREPDETLASPLLSAFLIWSYKASSLSLSLSLSLSFSYDERLGTKDLLIFLFFLKQDRLPNIRYTKMERSTCSDTKIFTNLFCRRDEFENIPLPIFRWNRATKRQDTPLYILANQPSLSLQGYLFFLSNISNGENNAGTRMEGDSDRALFG